MAFNIRPAVPQDCDGILNLIKALAVYEEMEDQVAMNAETLRRDGFGEDKYFHSLVAEVPGQNGSPSLVGYCVYFFTYSTWNGRMIYIEDLFVLPEHRGHGIGNKFLKTVAQVGVDRECARIHFICLECNKSAREFYKRKSGVNLSEKEGWELWGWNKNAIKELAES